MFKVDLRAFCWCGHCFQILVSCDFADDSWHLMTSPEFVFLRQLGGSWSERRFQLCQPSGSSLGIWGYSRRHWVSINSGVGATWRKTPQELASSWQFWYSILDAAAQANWDRELWVVSCQEAWHLKLSREVFHSRVEQFTIVLDRLFGLELIIVSIVFSRPQSSEHISKNTNTPCTFCQKSWHFFANVQECFGLRCWYQLSSA